MRRRIDNGIRLFCALVLLAMCGVAAASEYHGQVSFRGQPVPGATVTITEGSKRFVTVSDQGGLYTFVDLPGGAWKIDIEMQGFSTIHSEVNLPPTAPPANWELSLLRVDQLMAIAKTSSGTQPATPTVSPRRETTDGTAPALPKRQQDLDQDSSDGFLVNGSVSNAATSRFALDRAFGNRRPNSKSLFTGGFAAFFDNSSLDARPFSLSGLNSPKASYNRITAAVTLGGPIKIPRLWPHGPTFFLGYQWTRDHDAETQSALVPTVAERAGDLSGLLNLLGQPAVIVNPATGQPFAGNLVPVKSQANALLQLYPLPNIVDNPLYNYQLPVLDSTHQDALQSRLDKTLGRKDQLYGSFNFRSTRAASSNLFRFTDKTATLGVNTNINWAHRFNQLFFVYAGYRLSRLRVRTEPYFQNRQNISAAAGIAGNDQDPTNWGPPTLNFASGIAPLSDGQSSFNRNRTDAFSASVALYRGRHNITLGGDLRKQQFNDFFQQDPRGTFTFTGSATSSGAPASGSDFADFLLGVPDTSAIAFGNADKYLRQPVYDAYATDDWRALSSLTINAGLRWEYGAPITELHGRLANLDLASGFAAGAPVLGTNPIGPVTGERYPRSLIRSDKLGFEPRVGISWRPIPASTIVVRAGYGIYHDTSVYHTSALALAQQAPFSKSLSVQNSPACPLTLADAFNPCSSSTSDNFAVDPRFRVGYAQTWQLSIQRDLPAALQLTATYLGVKGTRGVQQFLPNTYPLGTLNPCPDCPAGFVYQTSGGNSSRESAQVQLRRRLRSGLTASLLYTYSKSIDDDAYLGGQGHVESSAQNQGAPSAQGQTEPAQTNTQAQTPAPKATIAQNWLDLRAERSRSSFDQRHLLTLQAQYTTGQGLGGETLMSGWSGRFFKEWTVLTQLVAGTGLPQTPVYLAAVSGTGFTGTIRPDRTGASIYNSTLGRHLNPSAYSAPLPGQWGTAGRNSIDGPNQFSLNASLARTFRPSTRFYLDARVDSSNLLNHAVFTGWNTTVNSTQFGLPVSANPMRSLETSLRLRF